jgi:hypothetical protein
LQVLASRLAAWSSPPIALLSAPPPHCHPAANDPLPDPAPGKYRRGEQAPAGSRQLTDWGEPPVYDSDALHDTIEVLAGIGTQRGVSPAQVALAYTLGRPAVTSVVIGARTAGQLRTTWRPRLHRGRADGWTR